MSDLKFMRRALRLARRAYGQTSPNPMLGAVLVKAGRIIGRGWHHAAGCPHAEIEALYDAQKRRHNARGATIYVTLEPCSTQGRTPSCTGALIAAGVKRVVVGATDPNPKHAGKGFKILRKAGIAVDSLAMPECVSLNEAFNHWIVKRTPWVTVKAAMTLDGKIATAAGESKWITGEAARAEGLRLRQGSDAILVGVNTILADDPSLTARTMMAGGGLKVAKAIRRIVLDSQARTPLTARVVNDEQAASTTIVIGKDAPKRRAAALAKKVNVLVAPYARVKSHSSTTAKKIDLRWLMKRLGAENVTSLLVEGGGEVNAAFLLAGLAQRVAFFYAPKILGGRDARKAVAGDGVKSLTEIIELADIKWRMMGNDLLLEAKIKFE